LIPFSTNIATKPGIIEDGPENNAAPLLFASLQSVPLVIHEATASRVARLPGRIHGSLTHAA
jgi:hypothetical protein